MLRRRELCGFLALRLAVIALGSLAACTAKPDQRVGADLDAVIAAIHGDRDELLAANPAFGRIAAVDPAEAQRLLDATNQMLRERMPTGGSTKLNLKLNPAYEDLIAGEIAGSLFLNASDKALLTENPLLGQLFYLDPVAALELLKRIKAAGGGSQ